MSDALIEALAVDTRRQIFTMLLQRPRSVQELADELPVSRPAVSQHLKTLVEAGLATSTTVGTRNVYAPDPEGLSQLRTWADQLWSAAMESFAVFVDTEEEGIEMPETTAPIVKTRHLSAPPDKAFDLFTNRIDEWWPTVTHSVSNAEAAEVRLEPGVGGAIVELTPDGEKHEWGRITEWEEGRRVAYSWYPGRTAELATHVEISFRPSAGGTEMILIHTGWEIRGDEAEQVRDGYDTGWDIVLEAYADSVSEQT